MYYICDYSCAYQLARYTPAHIPFEPLKMYVRVSADVPSELEGYQSTTDILASENTGFSGVEGSSLFSMYQ